MKITFGLVAVFCVTSLRAQVQQDCLGGGLTVSRDGHKNLYTGQQDFSLALLQAINTLMPNDNLFFSPYSTYHALLIAYFIAGNQTENFLRKTLRLDSTHTKSDVHAAYKLDKFLTNITANGNTAYEFTSANKIFVADTIPVRDCIMDIFSDELNITKFAKNPEGARTYINQWVEERTHNMIKELLPGGSIDETTDLVLVNAAYFKGTWLRKFNPSETKPEIFYVSPSKQIMVEMMHLEGSFNYEVSEKLGVHILEMPYKGEDISMYILLPPFTKNDALAATLKNLDLKEFQSIVKGKNSFSHNVKVSFPKFSLEQTIELVPILEAIGVGDLYQPTRDLSTLSDTPTHLDRAIHKAKIEVTEEGTTAAGATVQFSFRSSRPAEPAQFVCNHPFVYILYEKTREAVLFTGVFRSPN